MPTLPYKVGTDVHQSIFGSMVYAKPYSNLPQTLNASNAVRPPHRAVTCFDFKRKAHAIAGCFGSDDVGPEHSGGAKQLYTVMENCDIGRREDLTQDMLGGLSGDNLLERVPLLWCVLHN